MRPSNLMFPEILCHVKVKWIDKKNIRAQICLSRNYDVIEPPAILLFVFPEKLSFRQNANASDAICRHHCIACVHYSDYQVNRCHIVHKLEYKASKLVTLRFHIWCTNYMNRSVCNFVTKFNFILCILNK